MSQSFNINIDTADLRVFDNDLYNKLLMFPQEMIPIFDLIINDIFETNWPGEATKRIQVRTFNLEDRKSMRDLDPDDIGTMICISGMVIRTSNIVPDLKTGMWLC